MQFINEINNVFKKFAHASNGSANNCQEVWLAHRACQLQRDLLRMCNATGQIGSVTK